MLESPAEPLIALGQGFLVELAIAEFTDDSDQTHRCTDWLASPANC